MYFAFVHSHIFYAIEVYNINIYIYGTIIRSHMDSLLNLIMRFCVFYSLQTIGRMLVNFIFGDLVPLPVRELYDLKISTIVLLNM